MTLPSEPPETPHIRSFILRQGRTTAGQKLAIETLWETYCLDPKKNLDLCATFNNSRPVIIEIGFGNGDSLAKMAEANPDKNYLGIEVHKPGVGHLMLLLAEKKLTNVRIFHHDAIEILEQRLSDHSIHGVQLFFPDPWHKRRHHKRRIVSEHFLTLLSKKLIIGGYFHTATDWESYAIDMLKKLKEHAEFMNQDLNNGYCVRPDYRPLTKFEQRGVRLGHGVWDLIFKKQ
ncbi:MAG: tRNA (guanosine(46)-N7)-methyltransferase TrmB [Methylococcales bacterium]|nr:tRNA (guanosine(46)-N7)-methyltransferase TrmB [Methylococcales bacterium]